MRDRGIPGAFGAEQGAEAGSFPRRPSIPPILMLSLALWASCAAVYQALSGCDAVCCAAICAIAVGAAGISCIALWRFERGRPLLLAATGVLLGLAVAGGHAAEAHASSEALAGHPSGAALLMALEDSSPSDFGSRCLFEVRFSDGSCGMVQAYLDADAPQVHYGQVLKGVVGVSEPSASAAAWHWRIGSAGTASLSNASFIERDDAFGAIVDLRIAAIRFLGEGGDRNGVLRALACGFTPVYDESPLVGAFAACGLSHVVAESGAHLVIVSSIMGVLLRSFRLPRKARAAAQILIMAGYLVLTGCPVSAVRAFAMAASMQVASLSRRRGAGLASLGCCIAAMVALDAKAALSVSFALSALSTLGIGLFFGLMSSWARSLSRRMPSLVADSLALTAASSIFAQPLSCALFSQLPLVSLPANAIVAPLVAPLCASGIAAALAGSIVPALGAPIRFAAGCLCGIFEGIVGACASVPFASIAVSLPAMAALALSLVVACLLWAFWPLPIGPARSVRMKCACVAGCLALAALAAILVPFGMNGGTRLVMLDVGQGDAFLLRSGGHDVLIDTGANGMLLKQALARQNVRSLDAVLLSHADDDHCGALSDLKGYIAVERVLVAADAMECPCESCRDMLSDARELAGEEGVTGLEAGDAVSFGSYRMKVIWPERFEDEGGNADSLCLDVAIDLPEGSSDARVLMTGDAEAGQLAEMLEGAPQGGYDVLKVGHHGSAASLDERTCAAVSPSIALISVGEGNRYGHPAESTLSLLEAEGAAVFRTDERGDVSCRFSREGIEVECLR